MIARALSTLCMLCAVPFASLLNTGTAWAWGDQGHKAVATIAYSLLSEPLQAAVDKILADDPVTAACGSGSFIEDAVWADKLRQNPGKCASGESWGNTQRWHFLDIPTSAATYEHQRDCGADDCVIGKIRTFQAMVADKSETPARRRDALKFLIHFVGDLHQPLHTTSAPFDRANAEKAEQLGAKKGNTCLVRSLPVDRGGNCVDVRYMSNPSGGGEGKATELHAFWDTDVVSDAGTTPADVAQKAMGGVSAAEIKAMQQGSLEDWTNEGHRIAVQVVYGELPGGAMPQLQGTYSKDAGKAALVQMRRAGVRLAKVVEDALK